MRCRPAYRKVVPFQVQLWFANHLYNETTEDFVCLIDLTRHGLTTNRKPIITFPGLAVSAWPWRKPCSPKRMVPVENTALKPIRVRSPKKGAGTAHLLAVGENILSKHLCFKLKNEKLCH